MIDFRPIGETRCRLGEGPAYDDRRDVLWYTDIEGRKVHAYRLGDGSERAWDFEGRVGSLGVCESGRLILAMEHAVFLFDPDTGAREALGEVETDRPDTRLNDGKVGPDGAFWVGTMHEAPPGEARQPRGALYRVAPGGGIEARVSDLRVSNGLAFSPDGRHMFHADTGGPWIDRWDFDPATGAMSNRTRIAEPTREGGLPDGAAIDADGNYWSAGVSAACLVKYTPDGEVLERHELPVAAPTMPCFAGDELKRMFVTSLRHGRDPALLERFPTTGIVIAADSPVAGCPVSRFADR